MIELTKEMLVGTMLKHVDRAFLEMRWTFGVVQWCLYCGSLSSEVTASPDDEEIWYSIRRFYARHKHCTEATERLRTEDIAEDLEAAKTQAMLVRSENKRTDETVAAYERRVRLVDHIATHPYNACAGCPGCDVDKILRRA